MVLVPRGESLIAKLLLRLFWLQNCPKIILHNLKCNSREEVKCEICKVLPYSLRLITLAKGPRENLYHIVCLEVCVAIISLYHNPMFIRLVFWKQTKAFYPSSSSSKRMNLWRQCAFFSQNVLTSALQQAHNSRRREQWCALICKTTLNNFWCIIIIINDEKKSATSADFCN